MRLDKVSSNSGIYKFVNMVTTRVYVGMSYDIEARHYHHLSNLKNNRHINAMLQNDFNHFGIESFDFGIIEHLPFNNEYLMREREKFWIAQFPLVYNVLPGIPKVERNKAELNKSDANIISGDLSNFLTCPQVASLLGVKSRAVQRWCQSGKLGTNVYGQYLIGKEELEKFVKPSRGPKVKNEAK